MTDDVPEARMPPATHPRGRSTDGRRGRGARLLLLVPFVALLAVPLYAREEPMLLGWPFFYWYQFAWALITIALMALVHGLTGSWTEDDRVEPSELDDPER